MMLLVISVSIYSGCSSDQILRDSVAIIPKTDSTVQQNAKAQSPTYVFRSGDQMRITIRGYSEFDTTIVVTEEGTISMRLIGELSVKGITREQLIKNIKSKLSVYIKTVVDPTVVLLNAAEQKVAVLGTVGRQDSYSIPNDVTILQILAMAGGATVDADLQHIKLFRNGDAGNVEEIDITKYISNGSIREMPMVKPGDIVYVPREENIIRELSSFFRDTIFLFTLFTISK